MLHYIWPMRQGKTYGMWARIGKFICGMKASETRTLWVNGTVYEVKARKPAPPKVNCIIDELSNEAE